MCQNLRSVYNPYSRKTVVVKCGHCPACLQEKASHRTSRLRNNVKDGLDVLFVTLTYSNDYVPYILKSELLSDSPECSVYRDKSVRFVFSRYKGYSLKVDDKSCIISRVYIPFACRSSYEVSQLFSIRNGDSDKVSVCWLPDGQKFIKRLRQILFRNFNFYGKFTYFLCSEYGSESKRAHLHLLLYVPAGSYEVFRKAIIIAWPYADYARTSQYVEYARNAASYVSSYVNCRVSIPACLQIPVFAPKHTYSQGLGCNLDVFSLSALLRKIDSRTLFYHIPKKFDGTSESDVLPIPKYVLNRFFPRHKGFGRFTLPQLQRILVCPQSISDYQDPLEFTSLFVDKKEYRVFNSVGFKFDNPLYHFSPLESYRIYVNLENCYKKFHLETGLGRLDYSYYYIAAWNLYFSTVLEFSFRDVDNFNSFYLNAVEYAETPDVAPTLDFAEIEFNPNNVESIVTNHSRYLQAFYLYDKTRKVTNYVLSQKIDV